MTGKSGSAGWDPQDLERWNRIRALLGLLWDLDLAQLDKVEKAIHEIRHARKSKKT